MSGETIPRWPESALPAPSLSDNLSMDFPDLVTRTDFDQGLPRQRSLYEGGATRQYITWPMDATQLRIFHGFWRNELANGTNWFTLPIFNDDDYRDFTVRFIAAPQSNGNAGQITHNAGEWMYAAVIETLDETAPDETETAELLLTFEETMSLADIVASLRGALDTLEGAIS